MDLLELPLQVPSFPIRFGSVITVTGVLVVSSPIFDQGVYLFHASAFGFLSRDEHGPLPLEWRECRTRLPGSFSVGRHSPRTGLIVPSWNAGSRDHATGGIPLGLNKGRRYQCLAGSLSFVTQWPFRPQRRNKCMPTMFHPVSAEC